MATGFSQAATDAVMQLNPRALESALQSGADVDATNDAGETLLHIAAQWGNPALLDILIREGSNLNCLDGRGRTPLYRAVEDKNEKNARVLLSAGADTNLIVASNNTSALFRAIYIGQTQIAMLLLEHGAEVNIEARNDGGTPLLWAVQLESPSLIRELVARGANIHHPGVLQSAAARGRTEHLQLLLAHGAQIDAKNRFENTCLHIAAGQGHREVVAWLLAQGADPTLRGEEGMTALDHAVRAMQDDVIPLLREAMAQAGADPTSPYDVSTPSHPAATDLLDRTRAFIHDYDVWNTLACDLSEQDRKGSREPIEKHLQSLLRSYGVAENRSAGISYGRESQHSLAREALWKTEVTGSHGLVHSRVKQSHGRVTEYQYEFTLRDGVWHLVQLWTLFGPHQKEPWIAEAVT